jgi:hypothetical protein
MEDKYRSIPLVDFQLMMACGMEDDEWPWPSMDRWIWLAIGIRWFRCKFRGYFELFFIMTDVANLYTNLAGYF